VTAAAAEEIIPEMRGRSSLPAPSPLQLARDEPCCVSMAKDGCCTNKIRRFLKLKIEVHCVVPFKSACR
jgi:hypothetical protein